MSIQLIKTNSTLKANIQLPASKSLSNRALILQYLIGSNFQINNLSNGSDTIILQNALEKINKQSIIDVNDAGTAMRFLTSLLAITPGKHVLRGSKRMHERPIGILVDALRSLGAEINYLEYSGFPPIEIEGKTITGGDIKIDSSVSSQYITSLLLIGAFLENCLILTLKGETSSKPYIDMTLDLLSKANIQWNRKQNTIQILKANNFTNTNLEIENDWSSASYWYEMVALADDAEIQLDGLKPTSSQGDAILIEIFKAFGVETIISPEGIIIKKQKHFSLPALFTFDFNNFPDLAQTVAATCVGLGIQAKLTGLSSLRIKETDRLKALKTELEKTGASIDIDAENNLSIYPASQPFQELIVNTYNDHRMAMSLAPLVMKFNLVTINNPEVVNKSYPSFWEEVKKVSSIKLNKAVN